MLYTKQNFHIGVEIQEGDEFIFQAKSSSRMHTYIFHVDPGQYYLTREGGDNERIFGILGLLSNSFCASAYGYDPMAGDFPPARDVEALKRLIYALYDRCYGERTPHVEPPKVELKFGEGKGNNCSNCFAESKKPLAKLKEGGALCEHCIGHGITCSMCKRSSYGFDFSSIDMSRRSAICNGCHKKPHDYKIHDHSFKPAPLFFADDYVGKKTFFGWELEVESPSYDIGELAMGFKDKRWYFKLDGSLREGIEIVSHPMTFDHMKKNKTEFTKLLKGLEGIKCKSADTNTCGMHIHVSKDTISPIQLWKMLDFFRKYKKFVYAMSGRTSMAQVNRYASLGKITKHTQKPMSKKFWDRADKYTAINIQPRNTIEFRIFKGTLNPKKFFKNLEFVQSLIEWTRGESLTKITVTNYCKYIIDYKTTYPNLLSFMEANKMMKTGRKKKEKVAFVEL